MKKTNLVVLSAIAVALLAAPTKAYAKDCMVRVTDHYGTEAVVRETTTVPDDEIFTCESVDKAGYVLKNASVNNQTVDSRIQDGDVTSVTVSVTPSDSNTSVDFYYEIGTPVVTNDGTAVTVHDKFGSFDYCYEAVVKKDSEYNFASMNVEGWKSGDVQFTGKDGKVDVTFVYEEAPKAEPVIKNEEKEVPVENIVNVEVTKTKTKTTNVIPWWVWLLIVVAGGAGATFGALSMKKKNAAEDADEEDSEKNE